MKRRTSGTYTRLLPSERSNTFYKPTAMVIVSTLAYCWFCYVYSVRMRLFPNYGVCDMWSNNYSSAFQPGYFCLLFMCYWHVCVKNIYFQERKDECKSYTKFLVMRVLYYFLMITFLNSNHSSLPSGWRRADQYWSQCGVAHQIVEHFIREPWQSSLPSHQLSALPQPVGQTPALRVRPQQTTPGFLARVHIP